MFSRLLFICIWISCNKEYNYQKLELLNINGDDCLPHPMEYSISTHVFHFSIPLCMFMRFLIPKSQHSLGSRFLNPKYQRKGHKA